MDCRPPLEGDVYPRFSPEPHSLAQPSKPDRTQNGTEIQDQLIHLELTQATGLIHMVSGMTAGRDVYEGKRIDENARRLLHKPPRLDWLSERHHRSTWGEELHNGTRFPFHLRVD